MKRRIRQLTLCFFTTNPTPEAVQPIDGCGFRHINELPQPIGTVLHQHVIGVLTETIILHRLRAAANQPPNIGDLGLEDEVRLLVGVQRPAPHFRGVHLDAHIPGTLTGIRPLPLLRPPHPPAPLLAQPPGKLLSQGLPGPVIVGGEHHTDLVLKQLTALSEWVQGRCGEAKRIRREGLGTLVATGALMQERDRRETWGGMSGGIGWVNTS